MPKEPLADDQGKGDPAEDLGDLDANPAGILVAEPN
jgi:hypothetical protein